MLCEYIIVIIYTDRALLKNINTRPESLEMNMTSTESYQACTLQLLDHWYLQFYISARTV